jgi:hypothetical protein
MKASRKAVERSQLPNSVAMDADELGCGSSGGAGGQQGENALLCRGQVVAGRHG